MIAKSTALSRNIYIDPRGSQAVKGFMVQSIDMQSAADVVPRFSTTEQGESDLDLLKSKTLKTFSGGQFQRQWDNDTKASVLKGIYNEQQDMLFPTLPVITATSMGALDPKPGNIYTAQTTDTTGATSTFVVLQGVNTNVNYMYKLVPNGAATVYTQTTITLPAALASSAKIITHVYAHKGYLFVCNQDAAGAGQNVHRYNATANTWQDITGGIVKFATLRGVLYGINYTGAIYSCTNELAAGAATWTYLNSPTAGNEYPKAMIAFNGAIWFSMNSGLWRFDGVTSVQVLKHSPNELVEYNGALYYSSGGWLYRFNGSTVEKLQYFGGAYGFSVSGGCLYFITSTTAYFGSDNISGGVYSNVYYFNGTSFFLIYEHTGQNVLYNVFSMPNTDDLVFYEVCSNTYNPKLYGFRWSLAFNSSGVASRELAAISSEFDGNYANAWKIPMAIEIDHTGLISGDIITVYMQVFDGRSWSSSWQNIGQINYFSTNNRVEMLDLAPTFAFKVVRFKAVLTTLQTASTVAFKRMSIKYTLQPRLRMQARVAFMPFGDEPTNLVHDRLNNVISEKANEQFGFLQNILINKIPIYFIGPHFAYANATYSTIVVTIAVKGDFSLYYPPTTYNNEYPLLAYSNDSGVTWRYVEVMTRVVSGSGASKITTFTLNTRDLLQSPGLSITTATIFATCHKMYCTKLVSDRIILSDENYNENFTDTTYETQLKHLPTYEFVQV